MPLGSTFRVALQMPERYTDIEVGEYLIEKYFFVHLDPDNYRAKFDLLMYVSISLSSSYCPSLSFFSRSFSFFIFSVGLTCLFFQIYDEKAV